MDNPCIKQCPDRSFDCHISCKRYKAWREYLDEQNTLKRQKNDIVAYATNKTAKFRNYYAKAKNRNERL